MSDTNEEIEVFEAPTAYYLPDRLGEPVQRPLTADGAPMKPPTAWFQDPQLDRPTPLQVGNDGRVFGHIACWKTKHIGLPGSIRPPRSRSNYAFFATGALETAEGSMVDVGQISLVGGHAPIDVDVPKAVAHYDDTRSAVCDVAIGEDRHGIWVAGSLRPDVDEVKVRQLRASAVSGDWRPINGNLELVAVCSVNVPGFPIPRARVASGQPLALVAAGIEPLVEERIRELAGDTTNPDVLAAFGTRLERLEEWVLSLVDPEGETALDAEEETETVDAIPAEAAPEVGATAPEGESEAELVASLRRRIHPQPVAASAEELRARVHPKPVTASADELRARVHGEGTSPLS